MIFLKKFGGGGGSAPSAPLPAYATAVGHTTSGSAELQPQLSLQQHGKAWLLHVHVFELSHAHADIASGDLLWLALDHSFRLMHTRVLHDLSQFVAMNRPDRV